MVDPKLQERFARRCTDAAFGYGTATTAAYFAFAGQVLDFWASMLAPDTRPAPKSRTPALRAPSFGWPTSPQAALTPFLWPMAAAPASTPAAPFSFAPFAFQPFAAAPAINPFQAWFNGLPFAAATPAWPMAFMLIAYGMPSSVAWPTAEANAAAIDAVDAAAVTVRQVFSSHRTDGGHSSRPWPPEQLMMFAAFLPLGLGAMLAQMRMP